MLRRTSLLVFALAMAYGSLSAQQDPLLGTWKLNLAKSKFSAGYPAPKSQIYKYEAAAGGVKFTEERVTTQGDSHTIEYTAGYDGKDYPIKGDPNRDAVSLKRVDSHHTEGTNKLGGKVTGTFTREVSKDGKTLTIRSKGTLDGKPYSNVQVYDRQ